MLRVGTVDQTLLQPAGDDTRIDWGHAYVAAPAAQAQAAIGPSDSLLDRFVQSGRLPGRKTSESRARPTISRPPWPSVSARLITAEPVSRHVMIAYDEIYSIKFLGQKLRPYWRRNGATPRRSASVGRTRLPGSRAALRRRLTQS